MPYSKTPINIFKPLEKHIFKLKKKKKKKRKKAKGKEKKLMLGKSFSLLNFVVANAHARGGNKSFHNCRQ